MNCPYCMTEFLTEWERNDHIVLAHPEKTGSAEAMGHALAAASEESLLFNTAASLTASTLKSAGAPKETVAETFAWFLDFLVRYRKDFKEGFEETRGPGS